MKSNFCIIPWISITSDNAGLVRPCCKFAEKDVQGEYQTPSLKDYSYEDIWNGPEMQAIRQAFLDDKKIPECSSCWKEEAAGLTSYRNQYNYTFLRQIDPKDYSTTYAEPPRVVDLKLSNVCNFKCRSCGPRYSSTWVPDAKKLGWIDEQDKVWNIASVDDLTNFDFLKEQVEHVEKIYFAGGEPLMMPEHWQILDMLVEHKRFDVRISYNTNASTLTYGGKNVLDYWRQWEPGKIEVWPSIDEVGERAELIRAGTVWSKVEANLKAMMELDNIIVRPGMTIGAWNVCRLPEIITELIEIGVIKSKKEFGINHDNFFINMLMDPKHYHVRILPDNFKQQIIKKLENFVVEFNAKHDTDISSRLSYVLHELTTPFDRESAKEFVFFFQA